VTSISLARPDFLGALREEHGRVQLDGARGSPRRVEPVQAARARMRSMSEPRNAPEGGGRDSIGRTSIRFTPE
jgi:hypothetical protein